MFTCAHVYTHRRKAADSIIPFNFRSQNFKNQAIGRALPIWSFFLSAGLYCSLTIVGCFLFFGYWGPTTQLLSKYMEAYSYECPALAVALLISDQLLVCLFVFLF